MPQRTLPGCSAPCVLPKGSAQRHVVPSRTLRSRPLAPCKAVAESPAQQERSQVLISTASRTGERRGRTNACRGLIAFGVQALAAKQQKEQWGASVWDDTTDTALSFPRLQQNLVADVVVVGAGIAGLSTAYNLLKAGTALHHLSSV